MLLLGESKGIITLDITDLSSKAARASGDLSSLESSAGKSFSGLDGQLRAIGMTTDQLGYGMIGLGAAMLAPMAIGLKGAADLEQGFVNVKSALGDITGDEFAQLKTEIIDVGKSGQYSATQMAAVAEELAKAGNSVETIVGGQMLQAVSDLSSATGTDLVTSVKAINSAMAIWGPHLEDASIRLTDASVAADILTFAANGSQASVEDISAGMRNLGPIAATMGVGFDEAAATIAFFTNAGVKATVAGTALNTSLVRLADPTSEASKLMKQYGIDAFDAQGKFIGFPAMFDNLQTAMKGMTMEQKASTLATIFGLEAMDAMALAAMQGGDGIRDLTLKQKDYGIAAKQAHERTQTLLGAWQRLTEGVTVLLALMAGGLVPVLTLAANGLDFLIGIISSIPAPILATVGAMITMAGLFLTIGGAAIVAAPRIAQFIQTLRVLGATQGPLTGLANSMLMVGRNAKFMVAGLGIVGIAIAGAIIAYKNNFLGFADWMRSTFEPFYDFFGGLNDVIAAPAEQTTKSFNGMVQTVHNADGTTAWFYTEIDDQGVQQQLGQIIESKEDVDGDNLVEVKIKTADGEYWTWLDLNTNQIVGESTVEVKVNEPQGKRGLDGLSERLSKLQSDLTEKGWTLPAKAIGGVNKLVKGAAKFKDWFDLARQRASTFGTLFDSYRYAGLGFFDAIKKAGGRAFKPIIDGANAFGDTFMRTVKAVPDALRSTFAAGVQLKNWALDTGVPMVKGWAATAVKGAQGAWSAISNAAGWGAGKVAELKDWAMQTAAPRVTGWLARAGNSLMDGISSAVGWGTDKVAELKDWVLDTAAPAVTGWVSDMASGAWDAIKAAVGFVGDVAGDIGAWTLDTAVPTVTGWISAFAGDAWGLLQSAAGSIGTVYGDLKSWTLDIGVPTVTGWVSDFMDDPFGAIMDAAKAADAKTAELNDWTLDVSDPNVKATWGERFDKWLEEEFGMGAGEMVLNMQGWIVNVGAPAVRQIGWTPLRVAADIINGIIEGVAGMAWTLLMGEPTIVFGYDIGALVRNALGVIAEIAIDTIIDIAWSFKSDPVTSLKRTLLGLFAAGMILSIGINGLALALAPIALIAAGVLIYNSLNRYFKENPAKIDELKVEFGRIWSDLKEGDFGWIFSTIEYVIDNIVDIAQGGMAVNDWLNSLPGPMASAWDWAKKLTAALIALQLVAAGGGWSPVAAGGAGSKKKGGKGLIGGLATGLWNLALFPFKAIFNPVGTLKSLFGPRGSGANKRNFLSAGLSSLGKIAKAPFVAIANGFGAISTGIGAFNTGMGRVTKGGRIKKLGAGIQALWGSMKGGQNIMGKMFRGMSKVGGGFVALRKASDWAVKGLFNTFTTKGLRANLARGFTAMGTVIGSGATSVAGAWMNFMKKGITAPFKLINNATSKGMAAAFKWFKPGPMGIVANPKAYAQYAALSDAMAPLGRGMKKTGKIAKTAFLAPFQAIAKVGGKAFAPLTRALPVLSKGAAPFRAMGAAAAGILPALGAIPVAGWVILAVIGLIIAAIAAWKTNFLGFRDAMQAAGRGIMNIIQQIGDYFGRLKDAFDTGGWSAVWDMLKQSAQDAWNALRNIDWSGLMVAAGIAILNGMQAAWNGLRNINWGAVGDWILSALSAAGSWLLQTGWDLIQGLWQGIQNNWQSVAVWLAGVGQKAAAALGRLGLYLLGKGAELMEGLLQGIENNWQSVATFLLGLGAKAVMAMGKWNLFLLSKGIELMEGLLTGIKNNWDTVALFLLGLGAKAVQAIGSWQVLLLSKGLELIAGLAKGAKNYWDGTVVPWLFGLGNKAAVSIGSMADKLKSKGQALIGGFLQGITDRWNAVMTFLRGLGNKAAAGLGSIADKLKSKGQALIGGLLQGAQQRWQAALAWFADIPNKVLYGIIGAGTALLGIGEDLIQGLLQGAQDAWTSVENWLNGKINWFAEKWNSIAKVIGAPQIDTLKPGQSPLDKMIDQSKTALTDYAKFHQKWLKDHPQAPGGGDAPVPEAVPEAEQPTPTPTPTEPADFKGVAAGAQLMTQRMNQLQAQTALFPVLMQQVQRVSQAAFTGLKAAAQTNLTPVGAAFKTAPVQWGQPVTNALSGIKSTFGTQLSGVAGVTQSNFGLAKTAAVSNSTTMNTASAAQIATLMRSGTGSMAQLATGSTGSANGMRSGVVGAVSGMAGGVVGQAGAMRSGAIGAAGGMKSGTVSAASGMNAGVTGAAKSMQSGTSGQFRTMAGTAKSQTSSMVSTSRSNASAMASTLTSGARQAASGVRSGLSAIPGIIRSVGGSAVAAARSVGVAIGQGLASGLMSQLGAVSAAASALMAQANKAAAAVAMVRSPSRVWDYFGRMMAEGLINALNRLSGKAASTAGDVVHGVNSMLTGDPYAIGSPAYSRVVPMATINRPNPSTGAVTTITHNTNINVTQREGENGNDLALRVVRIIAGGEQDAGE